MAIYYVTPIGDDTNAGTTPGSVNSLATVDEALNKAENGDEVLLRRDHKEADNYHWSSENLSGDLYFLMFEVQDGSLAMQVIPRVTPKLPVIPSEATLLNNIRVKRNMMLLSTDWVDANGSNLTSEELTAAQNYRQGLRELPNTCDPWDPEWPEVPKCLEQSIETMKYLKKEL